MATLFSIFGSKEVSRNVANHGATKAGLSSTLMKKALPIVASLVMSSLSKKLLGKGSGGGIFGGGKPAAQGSDIFGTGIAANKNRGMLEKFLDADKDGSMWDDLLSMAVKAAIR